MVMMMSTKIKQRLSKYLGNTETRDPKDPKYKEKRAEAYRKWYPRFYNIKQKAEREGLTVLEYFEKYQPDLSDKERAKLQPKEEDIEEELFPCPYCDREPYHAKHYLDKHIETKHKEDFN
jgi:hypothetical protein